MNLQLFADGGEGGYEAYHNLGGSSMIEKRKAEAYALESRKQEDKTWNRL